MTLSKPPDLPESNAFRNFELLLDRNLITEGKPKPARRETALDQAPPPLDDSGLIHTYVDGFVRGQSLMLCNSNLRTEPVCGSVQLLSKKEGIISTAKINDAIPNALVKNNSSYWSLVHQALINRCFFPMPDAKVQTCYKYQQRDIPEGYKVHCTTAKELWRVCWGQGYSSRYGIPMDLLIFSRGPAARKETWYPIRGMDCRHGRLFVKLLGGEESFASDDMVVWLRKTTGENTYVTTRSQTGQRVRPDLRGYIRPNN